MDKHKKVLNDYESVSFDVKLLFTNVPVKTTPGIKFKFSKKLTFLTL